MFLLLLLLSQPPELAQGVDPDVLFKKLADAQKQASDAQAAVQAAKSEIEKFKAEFDKKYAELVGKPIPPVNPTDPLVIKLRDAYRLDKSPTLVEDHARLTEVMKQCAGLAQNTAITSVKQLGEKCKGAMDALVPGTTTLKSVLIAELGPLLPKEALPTGITQPERDQFEAIFKKFQAALTEANK